MKFTSIGLGAAIVVCSSFVFFPGIANAGWGHLRGGGSSGVYAAGYGSSGAAYGSSGAYSASYGSSGAYSAAYGSSGAYSAAYGSSGGYAAYASYGASSGGSSGGPGLLQRVATRVHDHMAAKRAAHQARRAAYGSSGYYSSGYSSVGGSSGGYTSYSSYGGGSSGYSAYSGGSSGGVSYGSVDYGSTGSSYAAPSVYYGASKTQASTVSSIVSNVAADSVHLTVAVPSEAKIYVNGKSTASTGAVRQFVSRGLEAGKSYKFDVRAELQGVDGQPLVEEKTLVVSAGQREQLQFAFVEDARPIETAVILNVPEGAKVLLSGNETKATGATRTFRTSQLAPGQVWDDYQIQVQLGDEIKSQTIRLIAGDKLQLTFDFDDTADKIASR